MDKDDPRCRPAKMGAHKFDRIFRSAFEGAQSTQEARDARRLGEADPAKTKKTYLNALQRPR